MQATTRRGEVESWQAGRTRFLDEVKRIVLDHLKGTGARALLFGSWARGEANRASDIDVAVEGSDGLRPGFLQDLREALEQSHVPYRVDVVDLGEVSDRFLARVLREGIPWTS